MSIESEEGQRRQNESLTLKKPWQVCDERCGAR